MFFNLNKIHIWVKRPHLWLAKMYHIQQHHHRSWKYKAENMWLHHETNHLNSYIVEHSHNTKLRYPPSTPNFKFNSSTAKIVASVNGSLKHKKNINGKKVTLTVALRNKKERENYPKLALWISWTSKFYLLIVQSKCQIYMICELWFVHYACSVLVYQLWRMSR